MDACTRNWTRHPICIRCCAQCALARGSQGGRSVALRRANSRGKRRLKLQVVPRKCKSAIRGPVVSVERVKAMELAATHEHINMVTHSKPTDVDGSFVTSFSLELQHGLCCMLASLSNGHILPWQTDSDLVGSLKAQGMFRPAAL